MSAPATSDANSVEGCPHSSPPEGAPASAAEQLVIHNPPGCSSELLPQAALDALALALPRYSANGGVLKRIKLGHEQPAVVKVTPPSDVLVLMERNGTWVPVPTLSTAPNAEWTPLGPSPSNPSMVSFVSLSSAVLLMKQSQENINDVLAENHRTSTLDQLKANLILSKGAYEAAKQPAGDTDMDMSKIGALALARDEIKKEIKKMLEGDADRKKPVPEWTEQVALFDSIELPFGYSRFGEGDQMRLYNIIKLQHTNDRKLAAKQIVTIEGAPQ